MANSTLGPKHDAYKGAQKTKPRNFEVWARIGGFWLLCLYIKVCFFHSDKDLKIQQDVQLVISVGNFWGISGSPSILAGGLWKYLEWIESPCLVFVNKNIQLGSGSKFRNCWHSWQLFETISQVGPCSSKDLLHRRNYLIGNETLFSKHHFWIHVSLSSQINKAAVPFGFPDMFFFRVTRTGTNLTLTKLDFLGCRESFQFLAALTWKPLSTVEVCRRFPKILEVQKEKPSLEMDPDFWNS